MLKTTMFTMRVRGNVERVDEFLSMLQYKHPDNLGFYCLEEVGEDYANRREDVDGVVTTFFGDCDGRVEYCMFNREGSYHEQARDLPKINFEPTDIVEQSALLDLEIEIYSEDIIQGYVENYHIKSGELLTERIFDSTMEYIDKLEFKF